MARSRILFVLLLAACGGSETPIPEIPPIDDEAMVGGAGGEETETATTLPEEGGPRVRLGRVHVDQGATLSLPGAGCREVLVFVEEGNLRTPADEDLPGGTLYRTQRATDLVAIEAATAVVALAIPAEEPVAADAAEPEGTDPGADPEVAAAPEAPDAGAEAAAPCTERVMGDVVVDLGSLEEHQRAEGKLKVRILLDREGGATFAAMSLLEGTADLDVPTHTHEDSAEVLLVDSGDGTMILGEERFALTPGRVVYVPPGTPHGYEHGEAPLRVYQIYAGPGPEQRFRATETPEDDAQ